MPAEDLWEGVQRQVAVFLLGHDDDGGAAGNGRDRLSVLDRGVLDLLYRRLGLLRSAMGEEPGRAEPENQPGVERRPWWVQAMNHAIATYWQVAAAQT